MELSCKFSFAQTESTLMTTFNSLHCKTSAWHSFKTKPTQKRIKWSFLAVVLLSSLFASSEVVEAQAFATIYNFSARSSDGADPWCTLLLSGDTLYGTAADGGPSERGTIFKLKTDGSDFTNLHSFSSASDIDPVNSDGSTPLAGLRLSGNTLYGTAFSGGSGANGTVFSLTTNGDNFQALYSFTRFTPITNSEGARPLADLVVSGNVIYGSTSFGGPTPDGTLFKINTDGTGFATFHSLTNGPESALVLSNNVLYGTTLGGGNFSTGTVFRVNVDGTGLTTLYSFTGGADGAQPAAGLLLSSNVLYGTTSSGGASGQGTVFKLSADGTGFSVLHSFTTNEATSLWGPNRGALVLMGHDLFGLALYGVQGGTLYSLNTNGTDFAVLHRFTGGNDGGQPRGGLIASGTTLYGTTSTGGSAGNGTVFSFSLMPQLAIIPAGQNIILTWPTNSAGLDYSGFTLQSTTNLASPVWTANLTDPVVVNGQNCVTNPISGPQRYFRLSQ